MKKLLIVTVLVLALQALAVSTAAAAEPPAGPPPNGFYHVVHYGETLASIGYRYGVNAYSICHANGLANCNFIYAGQTLYVPTTPSPQPPKTWCSARHTIRYGETLSGIARYYGVDAWTLAQRNHIYNLNRIYAGQSLCIY